VNFSSPSIFSHPIIHASHKNIFLFRKRFKRFLKMAAGQQPFGEDPDFNNEEEEKYHMQVDSGIWRREKSWGCKRNFL